MGGKNVLLIIIECILSSLAVNKQYQKLRAKYIGNNTVWKQIKQNINKSENRTINSSNIENGDNKERRQKRNRGRKTKVKVEGHQSRNPKKQITKKWDKK